ncbi:MAG: DNA-3-methyladenine glycosylase I [Rhodobacterales bacterium]|nr:DNA-3-methyladenine glycosylase I [Rhodobacterales bacterium]
MTDVKALLAAATERAGGAPALAARLPKPATADDLRAQPDDRYLSAMSLRIFQAGLKHSLVAAKWPAFEEVFHGFDPGRVAFMTDEDLEALMGDTRLIRHGGKLRAVPKNAAALLAVAEEAGSMGAWLADWPGDDIVGLWDALATRFTQLGGASGARFLRMVGKDTFILTPDVERGLETFAGIAKAGKGKAGKRQAQAAFNAWAAESGRPLCELSMIVAVAVG